MFNAKNLAMRDAAIAALVGATSGADFGVEDDSDLGSEFAGEFAGDFGDEGGFFSGGGFFGADAPGAPAVPTAQAAQQLWQQHRMQQAITSRRLGLLNPNEHSLKKVERYSLSLGQDLVIGTPTPINITKSPDTELRAQRIVSNVTSPSFVLLSEIKVANVSVTQGDEVDAWSLNPNSWGMQFDIPTLSPANRVTALGDSTSAIPSGFQQSDAFKFRLTLIGPASMAG